MNAVRRLLAVLLLVALGGVLFADTAVPQPYSPDEFPRWALNLRRGEIIAFGVFPISLLATTLLYDVGRFGFRSLQAGRFDADYAPWFFASPGAPGLTDGERVGILIGAAGLSITVAVVDYLLGRRESRENR
ncbi:MAG: hypothetical protein EA403_09915 [Spirochaetaceae bacterium]|nr:MAG: hypothetical protein EA403_09915 [Spirochaetaceae bacterium]